MSVVIAVEIRYDVLLYLSIQYYVSNLICTYLHGADPGRYVREPNHIRKEHAHVPEGLGRYGLALPHHLGHL